MTCSKLMRNADTGGLDKCQCAGSSKISPVSESNIENTGPASLKSKPSSKNAMMTKSEPEKVYGYIDLFKSVGDSLPLRMFPLTLQTVTIGRDKSCQIQIHDNIRISRNHCAIVVVPGEGNDGVKILLRNLTPRPTTAHKNKVLGSGEEVVLSHGDRFRIYDVELRWRTYDPINEKGQLDWTRPIPVIRLNPPQDSDPPQEEPILKPAPLPITPTVVKTPAPPPTGPIKSGPFTTPIIKITRPPNFIKNKNAITTTTNNYCWTNKSIAEQRRKSSPLPLSSSAQSRLNLLKIPRWPSNNNNNNSNSNNNTNNNSNNNIGNSKTLDKNQRNDENNLSHLNVMNSYDRRRASTGNCINTMNLAKRRGSGDIDMRKAVLQRSLRRAFKERTLMMSQTTNIDRENGQPEGPPPMSRYRRALTDLIVLSSAA